MPISTSSSDEVPPSYDVVINMNVHDSVATPVIVTPPPYPYDVDNENHNSQMSPCTEFFAMLIFVGYLFSVVPCSGVYSAIAIVEVAGWSWDTWWQAFIGLGVGFVVGILVLMLGVFLPHFAISMKDKVFGKKA